MTNEHAKIYKKIIKYKKLNIILRKTKIKDHLELYNILGVQNLVFSNSDMDETTEVYLSDNVMSEFEERKRYFFDIRFTRILAIAAFVISVIALLEPLFQRLWL